MVAPATVNVDARGSVVIPAKIRKLLGIEDGALLLLETRNGEIILRPAMVVATSKYSAERRAEFILNNAVNEDDYRNARSKVTQMGLDPDAIPHDRPAAPDPRVP